MTRGAYYPLLGTFGPDGPDHLAIQVQETTGEMPFEHEPPSIVEKEGVTYDPSVHWRTREGELVLICSMSDAHLRNSLRILWRAADRWSCTPEALGPSIRGDGDETAAVEWAGRLGGAVPDDLIRMSPMARSGEALLNEWDRRGFSRNSWWAR